MNAGPQVPVLPGTRTGYRNDSPGIELVTGSGVIA
jgi:hypothetical protein